MGQHFISNMELLVRDLIQGIVLAQLFQQSLDQGVLPDDWTTEELDAGELQHQSKVLEHVICHHTWEHLENRNALTDFQHGFRKRRNCETQLIVTLQDLVDAVNNGNQVDSFVVDLSKAFDRVLHQRLLLKLNNYGVNGIACCPGLGCF